MTTSIFHISGHLSLATLATASAVLGCATGVNMIPPTDPSALSGCSSEISNALPTWFVGGTVTNGGFVSPHNGLTFAPDPSLALDNNDFCAFQRWSARTFLWLTSPTPPGYGGFGRVFNSKDFYAVSDSDPDNGGARSFVSLGGGTVLPFRQSMTKKGPNRLPMQLSDDGQNLEFVESQLGAHKLPLVLSGSAQIEVSKILHKGKTIALFDAGGVKVTGPMPLFPKMYFGSRVAQAIRLNGQMVGLTSTGSLVSFGIGQAGPGYVLMAQNGSLVYYQIAVNAVYANFLSMVKAQGGNPLLPFPTKASELLAVETFAINHNRPLTNPEALAVEIKTSWVETTLLAHPEEYITLPARVPDYDRSDPAHWTLKPGNRRATLALVGMHVVGSVKDHEKMLWATFEHKRNTPNTVSSGSDGDFSGNFLFGSRLSDPSTSNTPTMQLNGKGDIVPVCPPLTTCTILPANLLRDMPWGSSNMEATGLPLDPLPFFTGDMNIQMVAVNNAVHGGLHVSDVRRNYNLIGTTWVTGDTGQATPQAPNWDRTGRPPFYATAGTNVGTNQLSNSTMESFNQELDANRFGNNCLTCHVVTTGRPSTDISHIFDDLLPLP